MEFINTNRDYIEIKRDDNGDIIAQPIISNNIYSPVVNEDRIVQIADTLYKVFDEGVVSAPIDSYSMLAQINSVNDNSIKERGFNFIPHLTENSPNYLDYAQNGNQRVKIRLVVTSDFWGRFLAEKLNITANTHKRVLGIWWLSKRTITYDYFIRFNFKDSPQNQSIIVSGKQYASHVTQRIVSQRIVVVKKFNCWATTPNVNYEHAAINGNL